MIDRLQTALRDLLPLGIDTVRYNEPTTTLAGPGWALTATCAWRLTRGGLLICSSGEVGAGDGLRGLAGQQITAVTRQASAGPTMDPGFHITGDHYLEIFADTDYDPWVMGLRSMTFVGSASAPP
jgi:hypothetical protein